MKLVQHPNVVRLYEVIDTQTKLYLILELGDGGDLYDYIMRHDSGLSEEVLSCIALCRVAFTLLSPSACNYRARAHGTRSFNSESRGHKDATTQLPQTRLCYRT